MSMYPLTNWKTHRRGYLFSQPTFYSKFHLGLDVICPIGTLLYAWDDCEVFSKYGPDGGNTAWVYTDGKLFRFLHLNKPCKTGKMGAGDVIGQTGNTGKSTGPHVHIDISKNGKLNLADTKNFIDPEKYFLGIQPKPKPDTGIATSIPVMGETTSTNPNVQFVYVPPSDTVVSIPVQNVPNGPKIDASEAIAPEGGTGTPPPEIADSVAPKEMTIEPPKKEATLLERLIESIIKFVKAWKGR